MRLRSQDSSWTERLAISGLALLSLALVPLTLWKESETFWLSAGGYPAWLRDCVRLIYYPYFFFVFGSMLMLSWSAGVRFAKEMRYCRMWSILLFAWMILVACFSLLITNNMVNLKEKCEAGRVP